MPYKTFKNWLFDGKRSSSIPTPRTDDNGKIIVPDILKYNSPIHHTFVISLFLKHRELNYYLNNNFNNMNLRYLSLEETLKFIKKCVIDFKIKQWDLMVYKRKPKQMLYDQLRNRIPLLKNDDISLLCDIIEKSDDKDSIYDSLGLENTKKMKVQKTKKMKSRKITLDDFLNQHFSMIDIS